MRKNVCIFLLTVLIFVACQSREMSCLTIVSDFINAGKVDSAKIELSKISYGKLSSNESKAYYPLLKAKIADLEKAPFKDSLQLNNSIEYFWQNSKLFSLTDAYFYKSCLEFQEKHYDSAFLHMKKAEYYSDKTNNVNLQLKIVQKLLEFNYLVGDKEYVNVYSQKEKMLAKLISSRELAIVHLGRGKDSLKLSDSIKKRIYAIQKTFALETSHTLQNNTLLNVSISIIVLFAVLTFLLYGRNKIVESKVLLEKEKTHKIKDTYEVKIQQLSSNKEKMEQKLEKMKGENFGERNESLSGRGKTISGNSKWGKYLFME